jgi:alkanesulfonate monooxygenase SsuD/methylene tetrahydromethanopterin reductase-like flavin-dependent oxidoreductase (luciferase family)
MAARIADGWNGWGLDASAFGEKKKLLDHSAGEAGRDGQVEATWAGIVLAGTHEEEAKVLLERRRERGLSEDIWSGSADGLVEFGRALEAQGASWAVFVAAGPKDRAELIGREVVPHLHGES